MKRVLAVVLGLILLASFSFAAPRIRIGVVTHMISNPTNQRTAEAFQLKAREFGWDVTIVDGAEDWDKINGAILDFVSAKYNGIFNVMCDPELASAGLEKAKSAGMPVINGDAGYNMNVLCDITSDNYELSAKLGSYVINRMILEKKTEIVVFHYPGHHGTRKRYKTLQTILTENPGIKVVAEHVPSAPWIEDARAFMTNFLTANPRFKGVVWSAWDMPSAGATMAIEAAGRQKDIWCVGIDGSLWVFEDYISKGRPFVASIAQNFEAMGSKAAYLMKDVLEKRIMPKYPVYYVPTVLVTSENCPKVKGQYPWDKMGRLKSEYLEFEIAR